MGIDRGWNGRLRRLPTLEIESYEDFCGGLRAFVDGPFQKLVDADVQAAITSAEARGRDMTRINDIRAAFDPLPKVKIRNRLRRSGQEMVRRRLFEELHRDAARYDAELAEADLSGPGSVQIDPAYTPPDYARQPFHLQSGGYGDDRFAGYAYHWGTNPFFEGRNDQDEAHLRIAGLVRLPEGAEPDGEGAQILDIACSAGQVSVGLKERFPQADVTGLDIHAAQVRYAHARARHLGADVRFVQAPAEKTGFADGQFDAVSAFILFHEVPGEAADAIVAEMFRILKPGGVFNVFDFPYGLKQMPPWMRYYHEFDGEDNCEPYALDFMQRDFVGLLQQKGFIVETGGTAAKLRSLFATKPKA